MQIPGHDSQVGGFALQADHLVFPLLQPVADDTEEFAILAVFGNGCEEFGCVDGAAEASCPSVFAR